MTVIVVDKRSRETLADSTGESATVILSIVSLYKLLAATGVHTIASINNMVNKAFNLTHE